MAEDQLNEVVLGGGPDSAARDGMQEPRPSPRARWLADPAHVSVVPEVRALRAPRSRAVAIGRPAAILLTFAAGAAGAVILFVALGLGIAATNAGRILPGVHVGAVDVSGLSRQEAVDKLRNAYSYLAQGEVVITTPNGSATVPYGILGRAPNAEAMADAALRAGRSGDPLADSVVAWRSLIGGLDVPLVIRIDPGSVSAQVRQVTTASRQDPKDAQASLFYDAFVFWPSAPGGAVDEDAVSQAIVAHLTEPSAPASFQAGRALITLQPRIDDDEAKYAIEVAERMAVDVTLTLDPSAAPTSSASPAGSPAPVRTWVIPASAIRSWIVFEADAGGGYGPRLDAERVSAYVRELPDTAIRPAKEPRVVFDEKGQPSGVTGGQDGLGTDPEATAKAVEDYLLSLARGGSAQSTISLVATPIRPKVTVDNVSGLTVLGGGDGAWTTYFTPGISNGDGLNIRTPAITLNGQIVPPGEQFSFLDTIGPMDQAHGYTWGGVIRHGRSDYDGAMGGGICAVSTTMFNAALRSGLQIDERHAHAYYISRYPAGLDATVYTGGARRIDLKWTNDTPYPIVIRSWTVAKGSKSSITIQLWSPPLDRAVFLDYPPKKENIVEAGDSTVYVTSLPPGQEYRAEWPTDGYDVVRTRTVYEEDGTLIHTDTWKSHYIKVDGILQIGAGAPTPTPTPAPTAIFALPGLAFLRAATGARRWLRR